MMGFVTTDFIDKMEKVVIKETDPYGKKNHEPGAKLDGGKNRMALVLNSFSKALIEVSKVGTGGALKYSENGWLQVPNGIDRYEDALLRHHFKAAAGEPYDSDTGLLHDAHRAWNALAVLELTIREMEEEEEE